jgi:hypothetical protein
LAGATWGEFWPRWMFFELSTVTCQMLARCTHPSTLL